MSRVTIGLAGHNRISLEAARMLREGLQRLLAQPPFSDIRSPVVFRTPLAPGSDFVLSQAAAESSHLLHTPRPQFELAQTLDWATLARAYRETGQLAGLTPDGQTRNDCSPWAEVTPHGYDTELGRRLEAFATAVGAARLTTAMPTTTAASASAGFAQNDAWMLQVDLLVVALAPARYGLDVTTADWPEWLERVDASPVGTVALARRKVAQDAPRATVFPLLLPGTIDDG